MRCIKSLYLPAHCEYYWHQPHFCDHALCVFRYCEIRDSLVLCVYSIDGFVCNSCLMYQVFHYCIIVSACICRCKQVSCIYFSVLFLLLVLVFIECISLFGITFASCVYQSAYAFV